MATKKGFKTKATDTKGIYDALATGNTEDIRTAKEYYRFNLKLPLEHKDLIQQRVYELSSPEHMCSITEYITYLIDEDLKKNGKK